MIPGKLKGKRKSSSNTMIRIGKQFMSSRLKTTLAVVG